MKHRSLRILAAVLSAALVAVDSYVTSYNSLPIKRRREWLQQLTTEICQVEPGCLSSNQLSQAPELMYAWSHLNPKNQFVKAKENAVSVELLLKRLIDERQAGNPLIEELTAEDYNCVLEGWARSGLGEAAATRCEQIVSGMVDQGRPLPNLVSFKATLMAWRQASMSDRNVARYAPVRTQRILEWMIRLHDDKQVNFLPDSDCFDIALQIWSRSGHHQAPQRAERLLGVMERLYERTGLPSVKPRTLSFNAVLAAWSRSNDQAAAERSCDILSFMELLDSKGDHGVAPDTVSFCTVMGALARCPDQASAATKAQMILQHVEDHYLMKPASPSRSKLVPDTILYNTAMGCLAKANTSGAYLRARAILERQVELYNSGCKSCKPDVYGFTSVIASCAAEPNKREKANAFRVALSTFETLQTVEGGPNHVSYGAMLKAVAKLLPSSSPLRPKWTRAVFEDCVERGCVGDMVLSRLREAACPDLYKELMQGHRRKDLPASWTRNVVEMNEYRKKKSVFPHSQSSGKFRRRAEV
jgi:hypothetical protein